MINILSPRTSPVAALPFAENTPNFRFENFIHQLSFFGENTFLLITPGSIGG